MNPSNYVDSIGILETVPQQLMVADNYATFWFVLRSVNRKNESISFGVEISVKVDAQGKLENASDLCFIQGKLLRVQGELGVSTRANLSDETLATRVYAKKVITLGNDVPEYMMNAMLHTRICFLGIISKAPIKFWESNDTTMRGYIIPLYQRVKYLLKNREQNEFVNVTICFFSKSSNKLINYLTQKTQILLTGELEIRKNKKLYEEATVVINDFDKAIKLLGSPQPEKDATLVKQVLGHSGSGPAGDDFVDDIPF